MWIVSTDRIIAEAIQITLRQAGISAVILDRLPVLATGDQLILDLDTAELPSPLPEGAWTFSRFAHRSPRFLRPFLLRALAAEILAARGMETPQAPEASLPLPEDEPPFLSLTPDGALLQGRFIALSPSERTLLALLLEHSGECVPTAQIDGLWAEKGGNTTAVYIRYLRKKLDESCNLRLIRTVRGRGYCLCLPE